VTFAVAACLSRLKARGGATVRPVISPQISWGKLTAVGLGLFLLKTFLVCLQSC
jgi:hypothetical protein